MSKIKELLSQAFSQLDEYNKGGATQHNFFGRLWVILRMHLKSWRMNNVK